MFTTGIFPQGETISFTGDGLVDSEEFKIPTTGKCSLQFDTYTDARGNSYYKINAASSCTSSSWRKLPNGKPRPLPVGRTVSQYATDRTQKHSLTNLQPDPGTALTNLLNTGADVYLYFDDYKHMKIGQYSLDGGQKWYNLANHKDFQKLLTGDSNHQGNDVVTRFWGCLRRI